MNVVNNSKRFADSSEHRNPACHANTTWKLSVQYLESFSVVQNLFAKKTFLAKNCENIQRLSQTMQGYLLRSTTVSVFIDTVLFTVHATRLAIVDILSRVDRESSEVSCHTLISLLVFARKNIQFYDQECCSETFYRFYTVELLRRQM